MALFWRIWLSSLFVNGLVLTIFVIVLLFRFDLIYSELVRERLDAIAQRTAKPFEKTLSLGLPLDAVRNTTALLERARKSDPAILDLVILDDSGQITLSTGARGVHEDTNAYLTSSKFSDSSARSTGLIVGFSRLMQPDGETAGAVAVVYSDKERTTRTLATAARLFLRLVVVQVLASVLGAVLFFALLRQPIRSTDSLEKLLADFEKDTWRQVAPDNSKRKTAFVKGLKGDLSKAERQYQIACHTLDTAANLGPRN
jgi:hypothetical protein